MTAPKPVSSPEAMEAARKAITRSVDGTWTYVSIGGEEDGLMEGHEYEFSADDQVNHLVDHLAPMFEAHAARAVEKERKRFGHRVRGCCGGYNSSSEQAMSRDGAPKPERTVVVCAACLRACCWHGIFLCDEAHCADVVRMPVSELRKLKREHPSYYSKKAILEQTGVYE